MNAMDYGKILLVEDDAPLAKWVLNYLSEQGFEVVHVDHGDEVIEAVKENHPDLVLLDWMLPGKDGLQLCRLLREFYFAPILMLTARDDEMDEVLGLELGATDYLIKPVKPRVLLARIQKALRDLRPLASEPTEMVFDSLSINLASNRVLFVGKEVGLTTLEFKLFSLLAKNAGKLMSREDVFKILKGREYDGFDRSLDVVISVLRSKFEKQPKDPQRIKTVWGKGYLFVPDAWKA